MPYDPAQFKAAEDALRRREFRAFVRLLYPYVLHVSHTLIRTKRITFMDGDDLAQEVSGIMFVRAETIRRALIEEGRVMARYVHNIVGNRLKDLIPPHPVLTNASDVEEETASLEELVAARIDVEVLLPKLNSVCDRVVLKLFLVDRGADWVELTEEEAKWVGCPEVSEPRTAGEVMHMLREEKRLHPERTITHLWLGTAFGREGRKAERLYSQWTSRARRNLRGVMEDDAQES